ncbi:unannotated protein [freshwater metagenome]|uniref:Unannotated protein n=1 Tax=freshwater metagenome TaxID=449393 RepID=A0A6J6UFG2_9ZZZZ
MGVAGEAVEEPAQILVQHRVLAYTRLEVVELGLRWQLTVDEQVRGLEERGLLGQLFDRIAAVAQDARVTVDIGDRRGAGRRIEEAMIEGDPARLLQQGPDVQAALTDGGRDLWQRQFATWIPQRNVRHCVLLRAERTDVREPDTPRTGPRSVIQDS